MFVADRAETPDLSQAVARLSEFFKVDGSLRCLDIFVTVISIEMVTDIISKFANSHQKRIQHHTTLKALIFLILQIFLDDLNGQDVKLAT